MKKSQNKTKSKHVTPVQPVNPPAEYPLALDNILISLNPEVPKPVPMIDVLREEAAKSETICDKARRLAREEKEQYRQRVLKDKQAFLDQFGLIAHYDDKHQYDLCGYQWTCTRRYIDQVYALFIEGTPYQGSVTNVLSLGKFLLQIDEEKARLALNPPAPPIPPSLWKHFKSWVESSFDGYCP